MDIPDKRDGIYQKHIFIQSRTYLSDVAFVRGVNTSLGIVAGVSSAEVEADIIIPFTRWNVHARLSNCIAELSRYKITKRDIGLRNETRGIWDIKRTR